MPGLFLSSMVKDSAFFIEEIVLDVDRAKEQRDQRHHHLDPADEADDAQHGEKPGDEQGVDPGGDGDEDQPDDQHFLARAGVQGQRQQDGEHPQRAGVETVDEGDQRRADPQRLAGQVHLADQRQVDHVALGGLDWLLGCFDGRFDLLGDSIVKALPVLVADKNGGHAARFEAFFAGHLLEERQVFVVMPDLIQLQLHLGVAFGQVFQKRFGFGAVWASITPEHINYDWFGRLRAHTRDGRQQYQRGQDHNNKLSSLHLNLVNREILNKYRLSIVYPISGADD